MIALAVLAVSVSQGGCFRPNQVAYAMPLPPPRLQHSINASLVKSPQSAKLLKPPALPSRKDLKPAHTKLVNAPPLPLKKPKQVRSQVLPSGSQSAPVPSIVKHYVVVDTVGNCAVVDANPADGLKIIGDKGGYPSLKSANKALNAARADCKNSIETEAESKFKAAQTKAEKLGVDKLTIQDIEGLSREQIKQLRGY